MTRQRRVNRRAASIAFCVMFLLSAATLALGIKNSGQRLPDSALKDKDKLLKQVEESPDQFLRVLGNEDCPLRLVEAKVKEVPGHLFTKLTGRVTDLAAVSSFPTVTLVNTSGQTVTRFFLAIREPKSRNTHGIVQSEIAIRPGDTYVVKREDFGGAEKVTAAGEGRQVRHTLAARGEDSEKKWMHFAARSELFITIVKVEFEGGSSWVIKEGGEVR